MDSHDARSQFRLDNETLAFRYTATLSHRTGQPDERLDEPGKLRLWLALNNLDPGRAPTTTELDHARNLREAIYRLGTAIAHAHDLSDTDINLLNTAAAHGSPTPVLTTAGEHWAFLGPNPMTDALTVIARDTIHTLSTNAPERIKTCEGPHCAGLFLDTSRAINRRWCSMNTCGNQIKKRRLRETRHLNVL